MVRRCFILTALNDSVPRLLYHLCTMVIFWTIIAVVVLALVMCAVVVRVNVAEVEGYELRLEEAMWSRRHKIPLLLEIAAREGVVSVPRLEMIDTLERASSRSAHLADKVALEKKLTGHLVELFKQGEKSSDTLFISLREEVKKSLTEMKIALHDYNAAVTKWSARMTLPWFRIFAFLSKNALRARLEEL